MGSLASSMVICLALLASSAGTDKKVCPNRWFRVAANLCDGGELERIRKLVETAAAHGLNEMRSPQARTGSISSLRNSCGG